MSENERCEDPLCSRWVRVELPISVSLIGKIATALPEGTMWITAGVGVKPDMANLHVPHDASLSMDDDEEDDE